MRFKIFTSFLVLAMLLTASYSVLMVLPFGADLGLTMNAAAAPPFSGGDGSSSNPFKIQNVSQLQNMSANLSAHYILISDIDASNTSSWNGGLGFSPIGNDTDPLVFGKQGDNFTGSFDGKGFKIINLTINRPLEGFIGLFGLTGLNANIMNVRLINSNMTGKDVVGGLMGVSMGDVINCSVNGNITGADYVGGLIGEIVFGTATNCITYSNTTGDDEVGGLIGENILGTVTNCTAHGDTTGDSWVGGLIGYNNGGAVTNCTAYGDTNGTGNYVGGLIGYNELGYVEKCTVYGNTTGTGEDVGGLIGENYGDITNCNAYGNTTGTGHNVGGLIGYSEDGEVIYSAAYGTTTGKSSSVGGLIGYNVDGTITNCTAYGITNGTGNYVGGVIGDNDGGAVTNCIAEVKVTGTGVYVGGLIGANRGGATVTNCTAYGNTTGTNDDVGGFIGYNDGGTVTNCTAFGDTNGSNDNIGGLIGYNTGSGTVINCTSYGNTYGEGWYTGGLIGQNLGTVTNSTSHGDTTGPGAGSILLFGGLIGVNQAAGMVENCSAYGDTYAGVGNYFGGLMGRNAGTVSRSHAYGDTGLNNNWVGGLIGDNFVTGVVTNCTSSGDVIGKTYTGGLIGYNSGTVSRSYSIGETTGTKNTGGLIGININGMITDCYSHSATTGTDLVGGLVGNNTGTGNITNCYSNGSVSGNFNLGGLVGNNTGSVYNSFWDNITSGQSASDGGTGKNTTEMKKETTFTGIGWNFTGIWAVQEGKTYPYFGSWFNEVYFTPLFITKTISSAPEDSSYSVVIVADHSSYPTENVLNWTYTTNASWLSIIENGVLALSGTPTNSDVGTYWVNVTIIDTMGNSTSQNFTLTVINTNDEPVITTLDAVISIEDILYYNDYEALDIDLPSDTLTWSLNTNAAWLGIVSNTGVISGIPTNADVGSYWVNVTVDDGKGGSAFTNFSVTVLNANDDPVITTLQPLNSTAEDALYYYNFSATDIDPTADTLSWSLNTNAGAWLTINSSTGNLSGTPENANVGSYWVNVTVSDGKGGSTSINFTLNITNINDDPVITIPTIPTITYEDDYYSVDFDANDDDPTADILTWELNTNASWLFINGTTGLLNGTPENADVGYYFVNVSISDGQGGSDWHYFLLTVLNVNDVPKIQPYDVNNATEDSFYYLDFDATDIDPTGDTLSWMVDTNKKWLRINFTSGNLTGTPSNDDVGSQWVNVTVLDGIDGSDWINFTLTVINVNDDPMITNSDLNLAEGDILYSVDYEAIDHDPTNDTLTWRLITNTTGWLSINESTGILSGTPSAGDDGLFWVNVTVSDGNDGSAWHNFTLKVMPGIQIINQNPQILTSDVTSATVGELYSVDYDATDDRTVAVDLYWSLHTNASWLSIDPSSGILSGTPTQAHVGINWVEVTVSDGEGGLALTNFTLTVTRPIIIPNNKPKLTNGKMSPASGNTDTNFTFTVHYSDEDDEPPSIIQVIIDGEPIDLVLDSGHPHDGDYAVTLKLSKGPHDFYFTASDDEESAEPGDTTTPMDDSTPKTIPKITDADAGEKKEEKDDADLMLYLALLILIIVIIALLAFAMSRRKDEELEDEELEDEDLEGEDLEDEDLEGEDLEDEDIEDEDLEDEVLEDGELEDEEPIDETEEPVDEETEEDLEE